MFVHHIRQTDIARCSGYCSANTEWMFDKGLLLWLSVKQEMIMKYFPWVNCFCKEQKRLMWAFAGFVTLVLAPHCKTSILKVAKLIYLQVTNRLNGYCQREVGHSKWIWLGEPKHTVWHARWKCFFLRVYYPKTKGAVSHLSPASKICHQTLTAHQASAPGW